ncbi:permease prefix domain 1-containing protein [Luedemannella flava]
MATPLDRYLADLAARLRGPRAARTRVLAEVRDGLADTIDTHLAGGMTPDAAAAAAIGEFGDPATIASAFAGSWPPRPPAAPWRPSSSPGHSSASGGCFCCTLRRGAAALSLCCSPSPHCRWSRWPSPRPAERSRQRAA